MKKSVLLVSLFAVSAAMFAAAPYPETGDQSVCASTQPYGVEENAGSTYIWSITGNASDRTITAGATSGLISVEWINKGSYIMSVQEKTADGCLSELSTINITVVAKPVVDNITDTRACSGEPIGTELPLTDKSGTAITSWTLISVDVPAGVTADAGNVTPGTTTSKTFLSADKYTNNGNTVANVVYHLTATVGSCVSDEFTITVPINPVVPKPVIYHQ